MNIVTRVNLLNAALLPLYLVSATILYLHPYTKPESADDACDVTSARSDQRRSICRCILCPESCGAQDT